MQLRGDKFNQTQSKKVEVIGGLEAKLDMQLDFNIKNIVLETDLIRGKVMDVNNNPIKDAVVKIMDNNLEPVINSVTDSNGEYSINIMISNGIYSIMAIAQGKLSSDLYTFNFSQAQGNIFNFTLLENKSAILGMINGTIVDINSNKIVGAEISLYSSMNGIYTFIAQTYTDILGVFVFSELLLGNYSIRINTLGYQYLEVDTMVISGEITSIFSILYENPKILDGIISGIIKDNFNNIIKNAEIILYKYDINNNLMPMAITKSNLQGIYTFINIPQGNYCIKANESQVITIADVTENLSGGSIMVTTIPTYDALSGTLENGAIIENITGGKVVGWLGGPNDGAVTIEVNANNTAIYNLGIKYVSGESRSFKIDVNGQNTQILYTVPQTKDWSISSAKTFTLPTNLNLGNNLIKFHGDGTNYAPSILSVSVDIPTTSSIPIVNIYRKTSLSPTNSIELKRFNIPFHSLEPLGIEVMYPTDVTILINGTNISGTADLNVHNVDNMQYIDTITVNKSKTIAIPRKGELFLNVSNISNILGDSIPFSFEVNLSINNDVNYNITPTFDIRDNKIFNAIITDETQYKNSILANSENGMLAISENVRLYLPKCKYVSLTTSISQVLALHEQIILEDNKLAGLDINAPNQIDKPRRNFVLVSARNQQAGYMSAGGTMLDTHPTNSGAYFSPGWGMFHEYGHLYDEGWIYLEIWNNMYSKNMSEKTIGFTWLWGNDRQGYENNNIEIFYKDYLINGNFIERGFGFGTGLYFFITLQEYFGIKFVGDMTSYYRNNNIWLTQQNYIVYVLAKLYGVNAMPYMEMYGYYQYNNDVVNFVIDNSNSTLMYIPNNTTFSKYTFISIPPTVKSIYAGVNQMLIGANNPNAQIKLIVNNNVYTTVTDANSKFSIIITESIDENSILKITSTEANKTISATKTIKVKTLLSDNLFSFYGLGDALIGIIGFDVTTKTLIVKSTGSTSHVYFGNNVYFSAALYDNNGQIIVTSSVIGNDNANNFASVLNGKSFSYGYYIKITHVEPSRLSLSGIVINPPNTSSPLNFKNINLARVTFYIRNNGIEYSFV